MNSKNNNPDVEFPQSIPGFFERLEPVEGAIDSVRQLQQQFDVYVLSAPSTRNPHSYSEKRIWIEKHFDYPFTKRLILSPNKGLLKGDFLIDDHITGKGQDAFEGEVLHFGSESFPDWRSVIDYLSDV
ncbi:MAG: hypothetical protein JJ992_24660 [Planctomycetes bacterium]|nr:hypothetical protein [Planctomycetota bacterium]